MKEIINVVFQFIGYLLQTVPVLLFYIVTFERYKERTIYKKNVKSIIWMEMIFGGIFTVLTLILKTYDINEKVCDVYMGILIVFYYFWFWKKTGLGIYQVTILEIFAIHYSAVIYLINSIWLNLLHWENTNLSFPYFSGNIVGLVFLNVLLLPPFLYFLKKYIIEGMASMDNRTLRKSMEMVIITLLIYCVVVSMINWERITEWELIAIAIVGLTDIALYYLFFNTVILAAEKRQTDLQVLLLDRQQRRLQKNMDTFRRIQHDNRHHIRMLTQLLKNQKFREAEKYLQQFEKKYEYEKNRKFCSYFVLNELLNYYSVVMENEGIFLETDFENLGSEYAFSSADMTIILSNCLENAVEECLRLPKEREKKIRVWGGQKGHVFLIEICNSSIEEDSREYADSSEYEKRKYHGFGINSIRDAVKKYQGEVIIQKKEKIFRIRIILPIPGNEKICSK